MNKKAVILLSGGLDSTTVLAIAKSEGYLPYCISFRYGQRHSYELSCATNIAKSFAVEEHVVVDFDLRKFGGSALTSNIEVPKQQDLSVSKSEIPVTYVPARNTIFLSFALAWAEVIGSSDVFIGVNALDYSGYPDCRPEFIEAYEEMANIATKAGINGDKRLKIHTPLIQMSKADIVRTGLALGVDYSLTSSCYDPQESGAPCGGCDSCQLRAKGFSEVGTTDPLIVKHEETTF